jgi:transposase-like protein
MDYTGLLNDIIGMGNLANIKSIGEHGAIELLENHRWPKPYCPHCGSKNPYKTKRGYKCSNIKCLSKFSLMVGTVFENKKIGMNKWFQMIFLFNEGLSTLKIAEITKLTQKTVWNCFVKYQVFFLSPKLLKTKKNIGEYTKTVLLTKYLKDMTNGKK